MSQDWNTEASLEGLDKAIEPHRILRIWGKLLLVIALVVATITISCVLWKHSKTIDVQIENQLHHEAVKTYPRDWFVSKLQEIEGYKHQLKTAKNALASIEEQRKSTWISRESDREIYNKS